MCPRRQVGPDRVATKVSQRASIVVARECFVGKCIQRSRKLERNLRQTFGSQQVLNCHNVSARQDSDKDTSISANSKTLALVFCAIARVDAARFIGGHSQEILRSSACGRGKAAAIQTPMGVKKLVLTGSSASLPGTLTKSHQVNSVEGHKVIRATVTEGDTAIDNLVLPNLGAELIPPPSSQLVASHHITTNRSI